MPVLISCVDSREMGGLADGYKAIYTRCGLGMFRCRLLAQLPVAGNPSTPRHFGDGRVEAQVPYMGCWSGAVLMAYLPSKHTHIYRDTEFVSH